MNEIDYCEFCGSEVSTIHLSVNQFIVACLNPECGNETKICETAEQAIEEWHKREVCE